MKLCLFIPSLEGGGAERMFVRLATRFAELGHRVDIVIMTAANMEYRDELSDAVSIIDLKTPRLWTSLPALLRYLLRDRPDAIISSMPLANGIAAWATRLVKTRPVLVLTEHNAISMAFGDVQVPRYRLLTWAIRPSYRFADAIVAVSHGVAERLRKMTGVRTDSVHVIYNPAWRPEMEAQACEQVAHRWLSQQVVPVIISAGRLEAQKDFATLLRAFAQIRLRRQARLVLLGDGSLKAELAALARQLGVAGDLCMPGFVKNPFAQMARARVFVVSSVNEGFANVIVEAMACGTPVVSTDCPSGPSEILEGGRYGPLVPMGDPESLAAAIEQQLDQPTPAELLRARAREFSVERSADSYLRLVEELYVRAH